MPKLIEGDTVRLKSGGPLMTLSTIKGNELDEYVCVWFDPIDNSQCHVHTFTENSLKKEPEDKLSNL